LKIRDAKGDKPKEATDEPPPTPEEEKILNQMDENDAKNVNQNVNDEEVEEK
jgi:hypothetical protein